MNRPIALVCYICGRQFGTKSLAFHLKSCEKKWQYQQNLKPVKERRPCPQPPKGLGQMLDKKEITRKDIQKLNTGAFNTFVEEALVQCEYCGRKFNANSLKPHQKACKTNPMIRKPYVSQNQAKNNFDDKQIKVSNTNNRFEAPQVNLDLVECYKCGRKFVSDRINKHEKVCKGEGIKLAVKQQVKQQPMKSNNNNKQPQKKAKWRIQHEQFQNALKYMKQMKQVQQNGGKISDMPPPPKSNYDHYVECDYCGRKYAPDVAQRHIPKCKNIINKPGGIKPSQIQQKYVQGTGTQSKVVSYNNNFSSKQPIYQETPVTIKKASNFVQKPQTPLKKVKHDYEPQSNLANLGKQTYQTSNQQYGQYAKGIQEYYQKPQIYQKPEVKVTESKARGYSGQKIATTGITGSTQYGKQNRKY